MRKTMEINENWYFVHGKGLPGQVPKGAERVTLPHSWNAVDGHDGHDIDKPTGDWAAGDLAHSAMEHYDRGSYWYYRKFENIPQPLAGGRLYVEFPAAGQQAVVYINGQKVTEHKGGYSAFRADVTDFLRKTGENLLAVNVSNEHRKDVYPQHADFTFYGGLYRGAKLLSVAKAHFDLDHCGGPGLAVRAVPLEGGFAEFHMTAYPVGVNADNIIEFSVADADGREIFSGNRPHDQAELAVTLPDIRLWGPSDPYLYTVTARIIRRNEVVDEISCRCGVRRFAADPSRGFIFNGNEMPLRGVCRHQDRLYEGNALTREEHFEDARIIRELGANAIRLAHYQHSQDFYDACDELGLIVWAEIPFITIMSEDPEAHENAMSQMRELIVQNYNHPCICFWGLSNEVLLGRTAPKALIPNHRELAALVKSLDPDRLTTIAHVAGTPEDSELHGITDVEGYNNYLGWYVGTMEDNGPWLDDYHERHPERCVALSEYGCEGIITYHADEPVRKDYTEDYQTLYHEEMARVIAARPWLWGSFVWNMFDFGAAARNEGGVAGRNNKGLVTIDRKIRKDSFYIYKAYWNPEPMVHICGKRHFERPERTEIKIFSNLPEVTLYVNGEKVGTQEGEKVFSFSVRLKEGTNLVRAEAGGVSDTAVLDRSYKRL